MTITRRNFLAAAAAGGTAAAAACATLAPASAEARESLKVPDNAVGLLYDATLCIGCTEKGIGFAKPIHALAELQNQRPPVGYPRVVEEQGTGASIGALATVAAVGGLAIGAGAKLVGNLGKNEDGQDSGKQG